MTGDASRLGLGTAQFGLHYGIANQTGQVSVEEARAIIDVARESHITTLDTAIAYGESEACLGKVGVQGLDVVTKLPQLPDGCADARRWVGEQMRASLERLGLDAVRAILLHRPLDLLEDNGESLILGLQDMKELGLANKTGVSIYSPHDLDRLHGRVQVDIVQAPFNLVDRRLVESGWLNRLKDAGVEVHTRSAFLQGLLLMPQARVTEKFSRWSDVWRRWNRWLEGDRRRALAACLAYPLSLPEIDRVIVGVDSKDQLRQIVAAAGHGFASWPEIGCADEQLINPANWTHL